MEGKSDDEALFDYLWVLDDFSRQEIILLRKSFDHVKPQMETIGVNAFVGLFEHHRDAFKVFIDNKVMRPATSDEVVYSWETKRHSLRVLAAIERAINRLGQKKAFLDFIRGLAAVHARFNVKTDHIAALLGCLRKALFDQFEKSHTSLAMVLQGGREGSLASDDSGIIDENAELEATWDKFCSAFSLAIISCQKEEKFNSCHFSS